MTWTKCNPDDPSTYPESETRVDFVGIVNGRECNCRGEWDAKQERWYDCETDVCGDQLKFTAYEVTHWRPLPPLPGEKGEQPKDEEPSRCMGKWLKGSGGHIVWSHDCVAPVVWIDDEDGDAFCDEHLPRVDGEVHPTFRGHMRRVVRPKDEELARLLRGINGVITFARDAWRGNDGAEGDAVRRLCDVAAAARRMVPCPDCAADKKEHARADKTTTEQPKENPERLTREELGCLGPIVATALAWYKEHEEELENVELEGWWPEPMVSFIEALSPIEASKLFAAAERDLSSSEQDDEIHIRAFCSGCGARLPSENRFGGGVMVGLHECSQRRMAGQDKPHGRSEP